MKSLRFEVLNRLANFPVDKEVRSPIKTTSFFGENVFDLKKAREYLSDDAYKTLLASIKTGKKIDRVMGDQIALGMRAWAQTKDVTHFTHWFQPLSGSTAEKHDSFFTLKSDGMPIEEFEGSSLIQQEPDASSFPSGGLRATFEARGYTAWDPSSPAFIVEIGNGRTLCIPTIFVSYTGESLDTKIPLLRSLDALNRAAVDVCNYFDRNINEVKATLGWEQEYFVIDAGLAACRPDIQLAGRTVFGHLSAKGQQLEDHYFGSIPERVYSFMRDFENEAYRLGIPLRTRHNEVAPGQYECAPIFEEVNLAVDHNTLLMDVMSRIARRHNLKVLLHEKPFQGVNGSGKHNNWSMSTNTGVNLLAPGRTPKTNLMFLTFFVNIIKAVHDHAPLLRASITSAGNDHRLGANEAPPAIMSIFIGNYLTNVLNEIKERVGANFSEQDEMLLKLDIHKNIPELMLDNTDRNRTSPFAFTGNKFEFRAVGSSANCAISMTVLNAIVAQTLKEFKQDVDKAIERGEKKDIALMEVIKKYIVSSDKILFEGDGYSEEWHKEAARRGLPNVPTTPVALDAYLSEKSVNMFAELGILNHSELEARHEIMIEDYIKRIQIEGRVIGEMCTSHILPGAIQYQNILIQNIKGLKELGLEGQANSNQREILEKISMHIAEVSDNVEAMIEARKVANKVEDPRAKAIAYCEDVKGKFFNKIRYHVDKLELLVGDEFWLLPKYREMLFSR